MSLLFKFMKEWRFRCISSEITWICFSKIVYMGIFGKIFQNDFFFSFGQTMKNITMVKIDYFCMK